MTSKFLRYSLIAFISLGLTACGDDGKDNSKNPASTETTPGSGNDGGNNGGDNGSGNTGSVNSSVDENLIEVPASQNNTEDADCDEDSFVEHCDGNVVVFCFNEKVLRSDCAEVQKTCFNQVKEDSKKVRRNYVNCLATCTTENVKSKVCSYDDIDYSDILQEMVCVKTSKGLFNMKTDNYDYCGDVCKNDTCKINQPCGDYDDFGVCDGSIGYFCDDDASEENKVLHVLNCSGSKCVEDEDDTIYCGF